MTPIAHARDPETAESASRRPSRFWPAANGEPDPETHVAPPSIMQIKITQLLTEQADARAPEQDGDRPAPPDPRSEPEEAPYSDTTAIAPDAPPEDPAATDPEPARPALP
ncbi:hypothetical protein AVJ23_18780 [Pseudoponticoccus marisrubri]|uniref:Uncharacterized protein n=1 Tax=Pseudoponticoccus marisrubri TaxID=1685382 RepID=A0A0W7WFA2_9RHOB|nr:hypothetical protein AVJ23_18780 [Pseudoponticoccus marisrubri]